MSEPLLRVEGLKTHFHTGRGVARAVDGVSFTLGRGETLGVVGESGCGKSVTALSILRLIPSPPGRIEGGAIHFDGRNLLDLTEREMRSVRGREIAMIFQEPMTSLNPVFTIGNQIAEAITVHEKRPKAEVQARVVELLKLVGIPAPEARAHEYPNQLSGGMRQRAMIAMALACDPKILIADEPTTALDVTVQAQILDLMAGLRERLGMSILLITHDLGVVAEFCDRVAVMYAGRVVEQATAAEIFANPRHPYTKGLLQSVPQGRGDYTRRERLSAIPGSVPDLTALPKGCLYANRCPLARDRCRESEPGLDAVGDAHTARCFFPDEVPSLTYSPDVTGATSG